MYEIDTTFNTNCLKLLLSVMVGINNYSKTFLIVYYYIILELTASFKFIANQISDLVFYDYSKAVVVVKDFFKGLKATIVAKAAVNFSLTKIIKEPFMCLKD